MTFSIVARCPDTGLLGVAVSSAVPAVGSMCPFVRANVGSISTQSWVNPYLAIRALNMMEAGASAQESLDTVLQADDARDLRQIGLVDSRGQAASWTGGACTEWAGHIVGNGFAIQGNMLVSQGTVDAMEKAFMHAIHNDLSERLLCALEAGQLAGGDKRGRQSACLKVIAEEDYPSKNYVACTTLQNFSFYPLLSPCPSGLAREHLPPNRSYACWRYRRPIDQGEVAVRNEDHARTDELYKRMTRISQY